MIVALVGVEEHKHALVAEVALAETGLVQAVDLGVCQDVAHTLEVHDHKVTMGYLPGKVGEGLGYEGLVGVLAIATNSGPARVVIVLLVLALDEVLSIVVLEGGIVIQDLIDKGVDEFDQISAVNEGNQLLIELIDNVSADEHGLDVVLHLLWVVGLRVDVLGDLYHILLMEVLILHQKGVPHGTLCEGLFSYLDLGGNLTLLKKGLLPVDFNTFVLYNEPSVTY